MSDSKKFSIIIPTLNEGEMLSMTVESILHQTDYPDYEVIIVDDGSTDGSCDRYRHNTSHVSVINGGKLGVANSRNLGAKQASGKYILFLDAHCTVSGNWLRRLAKALDSPGVAIAGPSFCRLDKDMPRGAGMTWSGPNLDLIWFEPCKSKAAYEVPFSPGGCQAFRHDIFKKLNGFDRGFGRWGSEDIEICLRAWLMGYTVVVDPNVLIAHDFRETRNFEVNDHDINYNFLRLIHLHFSARRIRRVLRQVKGIPNLYKAMDDLYNSDIFETRLNIHQQRVRSDDWFCRTFMPTLV